MRILVLNCGSSSIKYAVYDDGKKTDGGLFERLSEHMTTIAMILEQIGQIDGVGHRVVHGGEFYTKGVLIDDAVIATIDALTLLAPLHNKANLAGILAVKKKFPDIVQVAIFDTAFHQSMPPYAYMYPLPYKLYEQDKIRRYGFHGTSHEYIANEVALMLGKELCEVNLITFHLGNGDSVCAIKNGKSIDTSMGFTPLEGLMMGTRSGDLDPEILIYLQQTKHYDLEELDQMLNKESGLKGICGVSDMRDILALSKNADPLASLAIEMFVYHAKKYLGAYMAILGRVDAIAFTGGIAEHSSYIRQKIVSELECFCIQIDENANNANLLHNHFIHHPSSRVKLAVIHTDEEASIAKQTMTLLSRGNLE